MKADNMTNAKEQAAKMLENAAMLDRIAPHIPGEPRSFGGGTGLYGSVAAVSYKVHTIAELRELLSALPPVECIAYRGMFAGVMPADVFNAKPQNARTQSDAYGMHLEIESGATVGKYPCDEDAMRARWFSDTPEGRVYVRVDFFHSGRSDWPRIATEYARKVSANGRDEYTSKELVNWWLESAPPHAETIKFAGGVNEPGRFTVWFRDEATASLSLECIE